MWILVRGRFRYAFVWINLYYQILPPTFLFLIASMLSPTVFITFINQSGLVLRPNSAQLFLCLHGLSSAVFESLRTAIFPLQLHCLFAKRFQCLFCILGCIGIQTEFQRLLKIGDCLFSFSHAGEAQSPEIISYSIIGVKFDGFVVVSDGLLVVPQIFIDKSTNDISPSIVGVKFDGFVVVNKPSVELDALPAPLLREMVRKCIERHVDQEELDRLRDVERVERESLASIRENFV